MKFAVVGSIFFVAVGALFYISVVEGSIPNYQISRLLSPAYQGEECRVDGGKIYRIEQAANPLRFLVSSGDNAAELLKVESPRLPPDNFREGLTVGMRGVYSREKGVFIASDVTTACPTKYAGKENPAASPNPLAKPAPAAKPAAPPANPTPGGKSVNP